MPSHWMLMQFFRRSVSRSLIMIIHSNRLGLVTYITSMIGIIIAMTIMIVTIIIVVIISIIVIMHLACPAIALITVYDYSSIVVSIHIRLHSSIISLPPGLLHPVLAKFFFHIVWAFYAILCATVQLDVTPCLHGLQLKR